MSGLQTQEDGREIMLLVGNQHEIAFCLLLHSHCMSQRTFHRSERRKKDGNDMKSARRTKR
jgi:hypothetical protein